MDIHKSSKILNSYIKYKMCLHKEKPLTKKKKKKNSLWLSLVNDPLERQLRCNILTNPLSL